MSFCAILEYVLSKYSSINRGVRDKILQQLEISTETHHPVTTSKLRSGAASQDLSEPHPLLIGEVIREHDLKLDHEVPTRALLAAGDGHAAALDDLDVPREDDLVPERAPELVAAEQPERDLPAGERAHQRHPRPEHQVVAEPLELPVLLLRYDEHGVARQAARPLVAGAIQRHRRAFPRPGPHMDRMRHLLLCDQPVRNVMYEVGRSVIQSYEKS